MMMLKLITMFCLFLFHRKRLENVQVLSIKLALTVLCSGTPQYKYQCKSVVLNIFCSTGDFYLMFCHAVAYEFRLE